MSMSPASRMRRHHRADFSRPVRLFLDNEIVLPGLTNDISSGSISIFLSLKGASPFFIRKGYGKDRISLRDARHALQREMFLIAFEDPSLPDPLNMTVLRVEQSWRKGYDLLLAGRFENADPFFVKKLEALCPDILANQEHPERRYVSTRLNEFRQRLDAEHAPRFMAEYDSSYDHVQVARDLVASLANKAGFPDGPTYEVKLMADELLMNAYLYGSAEPGRDRTRVDVRVGRDGMLVSITDFSGRPFDDYPYHVRQEGEKKLGGLTLLQAYSDDWQVEVEEGLSTTVSFFKTGIEFAERAP